MSSRGHPLSLHDARPSWVGRAVRGGAARRGVPQGRLHARPPRGGDAVQPHPRGAAVADAGSGRDRMSSAQAGLLADAGPASAAWRLRAVEARALLRLAAPIALIALVNMGDRKSTRLNSSH